ncbi:hypothetical protein [Azohydromonas caseinilytica]|uniref:Uncharacterized protein n=1 Tax=Azohydromonas caseinilytica TaxID=2728836 RepID=A0A848F4Z6_9BURK|nr:hypothetical protein [Azohydromonas caseinilytica]NML13679.1 hypothetical protein [Azohydromonas caseinilytica]
MNAAAGAPGWRALTIDRQRFAIRLRGHDLPLEVQCPDGATQVLPVWRCRDHFTALRAALTVHAGGAPAQGSPGDPSTTATLSLDPMHYLTALPGFADIDPARRESLAPAALWWAAGGDEAPARLLDGFGAIDGRLFELRRWTAGERQAALAAALQRHATESGDGDDVRFDAVTHLAALLRHGVVADPAEIDTLPLHWALPLIDLVVTLNQPPAADPLLGDDEAARRLAERTLRLARALGWTPEQVLRTPAVELDRLLALLDREEARARGTATATAAPPAPPRRRRLADAPDAVLIRIDD